MNHHPHLVILAGPNGAGKSTAAPALLRGTLHVDEFVNADVIAAGLSGFHPEGAAIEAGRVMLNRLSQLAERKASFAFETTLSGRTTARLLEDLHHRGYVSHLVYLWVPSADFAVERVRARVALGGHHIPEETVRRRYVMGLRNFRWLYQPLVSAWQMYDGSTAGGPTFVARGMGTTAAEVDQPVVWRHVLDTDPSQGD